jgi:hypothetical protein
MKVEFSDTFAEQVGAPDMESFEEKYLGKPGTYRRYKNDRELLYGHIKDTFVTFLFYPLRWLPWGHIMETWWYYFFTESSVHGALDGMSFCYIGDAYVVTLKEAVAGKKHKWPVAFDAGTKKPYMRPMKFPLWLFTRIVWPQFKAVHQQYKENR